MAFFVVGFQLLALLLAILLHAANCEQPKPIVPSAWAEAGRMLAGPEISERTHGLEQQAIDGLRTNLEGAVHRFGEKALAKVRELKEAMPKKFQALVEKALQLFSEPSAGEKEQWDKASFG